SRGSGRGSEEGQHPKTPAVHIDSHRRGASRNPRVDRDASSLPSFLSLLFASGTRPRRRPRVHVTRGAHARLAAAYKRPTGGILLRRRGARMAAKKKAGGT